MRHHFTSPLEYPTVAKRCLQTVLCWFTVFLPSSLYWTLNRKCSYTQMSLQWQQLREKVSDTRAVVAFQTLFVFPGTRERREEERQTLFVFLGTRERSEEERQSNHAKKKTPLPPASQTCTLKHPPGLTMASVCVCVCVCESVTVGAV